MAEKHPVNQRVREIMALLGYSDNINGFASKVLKWKRSDKLSNIVGDSTVASTRILEDITKKVVTPDGRRISGHWLLTGDGDMFLNEKGTTATKEDENDKEVKALRLAAEKWERLFLNERDQRNDLQKTFDELVNKIPVVNQGKQS